MTILNVLKFPDSRLRIKAKPVTEINKDLFNLVSDMYETMYAHQGIGLAATQVNVHLNFFVMDISETKDQKICFLNPEILSKEGVQYESEACLSVTYAFDKVKRAQKIHLRGMDLHQKPIELHAEDLMAACIQHEVDHLNGILFIDHLSSLKKERILKKIEKANR